MEIIVLFVGREIISLVLGTGSDKLTEKVFDKVYDNFIQEIDAIDNGISTHDGEGKDGRSIRRSIIFSFLYKSRICRLGRSIFFIYIPIIIRNFRNYINNDG